MSPIRTPARELVLRPTAALSWQDFKDAWAYRELLWILALRDVKVRYKQAALGFAWAILAPLFSVAIYTLIFGRAGGMKQHLPEGLPYSVFIFAGIIPWLMIQAGIALGGMSLVNQQNLLNKIYMPRLFIPSSVIGGGLVDMAISWCVFGVMLAFHRVVPAWTIVFLPLLILVTMIQALGFALSLSALTVTYRDVRFIIPFMVQILMLLSAVAFPSTVLRAYPWLRFGNPVAGLIDAYRAIIFNGWDLNLPHFVYSVIFAIGMFVWGLFYFRKTERRFADIT